MNVQCTKFVGRAFFLAVCLLISFPGRGDSRPRQLWPYKALVAESDLVMIGAVRATMLRENKDFYPEHLEELESEISVRAVLKGELPREKVRFVHYRYKKGADGLGNGPSFPVMEYRLIDKPAAQSERSPRSPSGRNNGPFYVFFLKQRSDGRFEPVSGNDDAGLSVARIDGRADEE